MAEPITSAATTRFATEALPERDRLASWREFYGRKLLRLDWEPRAEASFRASVSISQIAGIRCYQARFSAACAKRTRALIDSDDDVTFFTPLRRYRIVQCGQEIDLGSGDAVLMSNTAETTVTSFASGHHFGVVLPRAALTPFLRDIDGFLMRRIPCGSEGLDLLIGYLRLLHQRRLALSTPELQSLAATHVQDLIKMTLGATRDAAQAAGARGVAAARLAALKSDILAHLNQRSLSAVDLARRHGISPRYVRALFGKDGSSVSDFVRRHRLERAHRMLADERFLELTVSAIAYEAGFGDLSGFNHAFRRRYEVSPSDVRPGRSRRQ